MGQGITKAKPAAKQNLVEAPTPKLKPAHKPSESPDVPEEDEKTLNNLLILFQLLQELQNNVEQPNIAAKASIIANRYQIQKFLGEGAFGKVVLVKDLKDAGGKQYAMKILRTKAAESAVTEYNISSQLDHPNLIKFYEVFKCNGPIAGIGDDDTYICILMEYCPGINLDKLIEKLAEKNLVLPFDILVPSFLSLLDTLDYVHDKNLMHRDLKPENILVICDETNMAKDPMSELMNIKLKIADFGVAKKIRKHQHGKNNCRNNCLSSSRSTWTH
jgi:serine/threonine protein kinase